MTEHSPAVLFVCTANICRSPMAEGLLKALVLKELPASPTWRIESAGTWTRSGLPAAPFSIQCMATRGIDISPHLSQSIEEVTIEEFDLILTMETGHKEAILIKYPTARNRVMIISELVNLKTSIFDPVGLPIEVFNQTANLINQILYKGLPVILEKLMLNPAS